MIEIERTVRLNPVPILNEASMDPSVFNLTILRDDNPLKVVKSPPAIIFPSFCIATLYTWPLKPVPILKVGEPCVIRAIDEWHEHVPVALVVLFHQQPFAKPW